MPKHSKGIKNDQFITYYWFLLKKLSFVLQPFYKVTIYGQGYKYMLYCWFTTIDWLLNYTYDTQINF